MLSFFRSGGIGNVVVAGIAFAIIVVFAMEFRAGRNGPTAKLSRECAVLYDGYCVDAKEYYAAHGLIVPRQVEPKVSKKYQLNKRVLDGLVERELLVAEARKTRSPSARGSAAESLAITTAASGVRRQISPGAVGTSQP